MPQAMNEHCGNKKDLVVLDMSMPRMSGDEALQQLRTATSSLR
ncbi:MAG: hypothetical protein OSB73_20595 [Candidatus Latescibacteria bacterium]|nr:hypothetical protein [Candidatus Latescibacterota bacterium]